MAEEGEETRYEALTPKQLEADFDQQQQSNHRHQGHLRDSTTRESGGFGTIGDISQLPT